MAKAIQLLATAIEGRAYYRLINNVKKFIFILRRVFEKFVIKNIVKKLPNAVRR
jgi:hypothetical protein